jgi:hypothetical protein
MKYLNLPLNTIYLEKDINNLVLSKCIKVELENNETSQNHCLKSSDFMNQIIAIPIELFKILNFDDNITIYTNKYYIYKKYKIVNKIDILNQINSLKYCDYIDITSIYSNNIVDIINLI